MVFHEYHYNRKRSGKDVIIPAPVTMDDAEQRVDSKEYQVTDWYFVMKKLPETHLS